MPVADNWIDEDATYICKLIEQHTLRRELRSTSHVIMLNQPRSEQQSAIVPLSLLHQGCGTVCLPISNVSPLFLHSRNILKHSKLNTNINCFYNSFQQQCTCAYESVEFSRNINSSNSNISLLIAHYNIVAISRHCPTLLTNGFKSWFIVHNTICGATHFNPYHAEICINHGDQRVSSIWNHQKCLS